MLRAYENEKRILEAEIAGYKVNSAKHEKTIQVSLQLQHLNLLACCADMQRPLSGIHILSMRQFFPQLDV